MDPVSIVGLAYQVSKVVFDVSEMLYTFVKDTQSVDQSVQSLNLEVDALKRVIDAIASSLGNPIIKSQQATNQINSELLSSVEGALEASQQTVEALANMISGLSNTTNTRNIFRQSIRQIRLNISDEKIMLFKSRIQTHVMILQTALQTIILMISCLSPDRIIDHVDAKIELVTAMIEKIDIYQIRNQLPEAEKNTTEKLKKSAEAIVSRANTTIAGTRSTIWSWSESDFTVNPEPEEPISTFANRDRVEKWISHSSIDENIRSADEAHESTSSATYHDSVEGENLDSDSDIEFEIELIEKSLAKGKESYDQDKFEEAEKFLRRGLSRASMIRARKMKKKDYLDLREARLTLALSYHKQKKLKDSEKLLIALTREEATTDSENAYLLQIFHTLAQVNMSKLDFETAHKHCLTAVNGRLRLLGNKHSDYWNSLTLLLSVFKAKGDPIAAVFEDLIKSQPAAKNMNISATAQISSKDTKTVLVKLSNAGFNVNQENFDGTKAFCWAASKNNTAAMLLLLKKSANFNAQDEEQNNQTPLIIAASKGHIEVAQLLLKNSADMETKDNGDNTALITAVQNKHEAIVRLLLEKGANMDVQNKGGDTALLIAARTKNEPIVQLLLEMGANMEVKNPGGDAALLVAARHGHETVVQLLLESGANMELKNVRGDTALLVAAQNGHETIVQLLLKNDANIEAKGANGTTALILAAKKDHDKVVQLLLKNGANTYSKDNDGYTAMMRAPSGGKSHAILKDWKPTAS